MCFEIDSEEASDSTIVERSPCPGLSVAEVCDDEDTGNGGVPEE